MLDCEEAKRWLLQARYTLESAVNDMGSGFHSWACFKAHQVAEYSLKGILRGVGVESFGHDLVGLWNKSVELCSSLKDLHECVTWLNKMYVPPRYPDAWAGGALPFENYTSRDARESVECARRILDSVEACLSEVCKDTQGKV